MERFEYKLVATPNRKTKNCDSTRGKHGFAGTVVAQMNDLGRDGWQFMRNETISENRRVLFFLGGIRQRDFQIYRRPLRADGKSVDQPVKLRRVLRSDVPSSQELKNRITALVKEEADTGTDNPENSIVSPFEVIRSKLN